MKRLTLGFIVALVLAGCTEQVRAKKFGGDVTVNLPAGQKLIDASWRDSNISSLWYLTRPMRANEAPETYTFTESSSLGILEGTVTFVESVAPPAQ